MSEMVCQHCGHHGTCIVGGSCSKSPTGYHVTIPYHDGEYTCQHCGHHGSCIAGGSCSKSPTGYHVIV